MESGGVTRVRGDAGVEAGTIRDEQVARCCYCVQRLYELGLKLSQIPLRMWEDKALVYDAITSSSIIDPPRKRPVLNRQPNVAHYKLASLQHPGMITFMAFGATFH